MRQSGTEAEEIVAERMCIVTREVMDEARLIRFVRGPDGSVVPDLNRKLPGRGVWVSLNRARVAEAPGGVSVAVGFRAGLPVPSRRPPCACGKASMMVRRRSSSTRAMPRPSCTC